jgi:hypothetical protein
MPSLSVVDKRQAALELRLQGHAIADIATALSVSPGRVSQLIGEVLCEKAEAINAMASELRVLELERIDRLILHWYQRAKTEIEAAEVLLHWTQRKHKLLGLDGGCPAAGGAPIRVSASALDLTKLSEQELGWLENIVSKAGPRLPPSDEGDRELDRE